MKVIYDNRVAKYMENDLALIKKIGPEKAKIVRRIVDALQASIDLQVFLKTSAGRPHALNGKHKGEYAVKVTANYRLIFEIVKGNEYINKSDIVKVKGVVDYHGENEEWIMP